MTFTEDLINNLKTEKNPITFSKILHQLVKKEGVQLIKLAQILNKKKSALSHLLRLNRLPEMIIDGYLNKTITLSHLYVISRLEDQASMIEVYERVLSKNLNVFETEILVRLKKHQIDSQGNYFNKSQIENLKRKLAKKNIEFKIIQSRIRTRIVFTFKGNLKEANKFLKQFFQCLKKSFSIEREGDF